MPITASTTHLLQRTSLPSLILQSGSARCWAAPRAFGFRNRRNRSAGLQPAGFCEIPRTGRRQTVELPSVAVRVLGDHAKTKMGRIQQCLVYCEIQLPTLKYRLGTIAMKELNVNTRKSWRRIENRAAALAGTILLTATSASPQHLLMVRSEYRADRHDVRVCRLA